MLLQYSTYGHQHNQTPPIPHKSVTICIIYLFKGVVRRGSVEQQKMRLKIFWTKNFWGTTMIALASSFLCGQTYKWCKIESKWPASVWSEPKLESIPGILKSLQIRALSAGAEYVHSKVNFVLRTKTTNALTTFIIRRLQRFWNKKGSCKGAARSCKLAVYCTVYSKTFTVILPPRIPFLSPVIQDSFVVLHLWLIKSDPWLILCQRGPIWDC